MSTPSHDPDLPDPGHDEHTRIGSDNHDRVIPGHTYDGIREYDNPMPGWWAWTFVASVIVAAIYYVGITFFDFVDTYEDDLAQSIEELEMIRNAYAEANPQFDATEATLAAYIADAAAVEEGGKQYAAFCAACHGDQGQGLIGPNLADAYWLYGGSNVAVYAVITEGVQAKGMPAWATALSPEERASVLAFIRSIEGSDPPGAKAPQGERYE